MEKDSKFTRDENGYIAIRTVSAPYSSGTDDKDSMFTRDEDGYVAVRTIAGAGGGGGDQHNLGYYATPTALREAYPTAEAGDWAIVGSTDTVWIWDTDNSAWVDSDQKGQVTSVNNQTGDVTIGINDILPTQTDKSGYVLGTDGFVAGWVRPEIVQRSAMPQASEDEVDNIYQFVGTTDATYTNGYFYKCVSDGGNPATYSWVRLDVQPTPSGLPSQTGNAGKFLTTDGTDASWSDKPLVNRATGTNSIAIGDVYTYSNWQNGCMVGGNSQGVGSDATALGYGSLSGIGGVSIGCEASSRGNNSITIGYRARSLWTNNAILLNVSGALAENNDANTFKVANANGNYEIMSADGTIPTARLTKVNSTITLTAAGWSSNTQTVNVTGMTATGVVMVSPDPTDQADYTSAGIICSAQAAGTLTFTCSTTPSADLSVNVVML